MGLRAPLRAVAEAPSSRRHGTGRSGAAVWTIRSWQRQPISILARSDTDGVAMVRRRSALPSISSKGPRSRSAARSVSRQPGDRLKRLLGILFLLNSGGEGWTASRIAKVFRISERRFHHDLRVISRCGFKICSDRKGYRLLGEKLNVPVTLSAADVLALLHPLRATKDQQIVAEQKLTSALPSELRNLFGQLRKVHRGAVAGASEAIQSHVDLALGRSQQLEILYEGLKDSVPRLRIVEPYAVFFMNSSWYLLAWDPDRKAPRHFRLDRIAQANVKQSTFVVQADFDVDAYINELPGVWSAERLDAIINVKRDFAKIMAAEARTRHWNFRRTPDGTELRIPRGHPDEVAWILASFGEGVSVKSPASLRARLRRIGEEIVRMNA